MKVIDLCAAEPFCMAEATYVVHVNIGSGTNTVKRRVMVCDRHLKVMKEHALKRGQEHPDLEIAVMVLPLTREVRS